MANIAEHTHTHPANKNSAVGTHQSETPNAARPAGCYYPSTQGHNEAAKGAANTIICVHRH